MHTVNTTTAAIPIVFFISEDEAITVCDNTEAASPIPGIILTAL